ncbi:MAG: stage IV sporulation protein A [Clostridia bacterium]|nr:stage IV sporulation protein A [Clostridia bacterium]
MVDRDIYRELSERTGGEVFVGVVGPVRTGKSTFVKRMMEILVLPNMEEEYERQKAQDAMPQSAGGRTVMTAEPKFIPDEAVAVSVGENARMKMRMIDCVGFMVPGAEGTTENGEPRMVHTPWSEEAIPFEEAAELGTVKVIRDHSTVGILVTTDGTVGDLPRENYEEAEQRAAEELKRIGKPFCIILNSADPEREESETLALELEKRYGAPVALVNCFDLDGEDIKEIFGMILEQFPVTEIRVELPEWMNALPEGHPLMASFLETVRTCASDITQMGDVKRVFANAPVNPDIAEATVKELDLSTGRATVALFPEESSYYQTLAELSGLALGGEEDLFCTVCELAETKKKYDKVKTALDEVAEKGYGIVMPELSELQLEEPEIVRQSGGYGVKLRASAKSIHMIKANIETEINPIVGTEEQSEQLLSSLMKGFEEDPARIWETDLLGKSLYELVSDGMRAKLRNMPEDSRGKLSETLERILNEGSGGLICILL